MIANFAKQGLAAMVKMVYDFFYLEKPTY